MLTFEEYRRHDAVGLAELIARGEVSPAELLATAIERREAVDPQINALSQCHYDEARRTIQSALPQGVFKGVPFLLKDESVQMAGTVTTNSCKLFIGNLAAQDSTLVARYRRAGLVIFGKTNTPELGLAASTETALHGTTRNPWNLARTAGGSSGGAAAAVAAGIVPAAQGSDGGGSIRGPASCCGLFGLKPTRARVPLGPTVGEGWGGMAMPHVLTRSVRDSALMLDATQGAAPGDPYVAPPVSMPYQQELLIAPGRLRVALQLAPLSGSPVEAECIAAAHNAAELMEDLGHDVEVAMPPGNADELNRAAWVIAASNIRATLRRRAIVLGRPLCQDDVEARTWRAVLESETMSGVDYADALLVIHAQGRAMADFHQRYDIVMSPTLGRVPVLLGPLRPGNPDEEEYLTVLRQFIPFMPVFNMSGQPSMSVPLHWTADEIPVGVMFSAGFGREDLLFRVAIQLEAARPWFDRVPAL